VRAVTLIWPPPNRKIGTLDALALTGVLGLLVARFVPLARLPFWGCAMRETTGYPCPGCGLTRVAQGVAHLDLASAWSANPLGTVAALLFVAAIGLSLLHLAFALPMPKLVLTPRERTRVGVVGVAAVLVNYGWMLLTVAFPELWVTVR
jgi:hypothetical protein